MFHDDTSKTAPAVPSLPLSATERAELRRQKILASGAERMSKVTGLYTKSSSDALACSSRAPASLASSGSLLASAKEVVYSPSEKATTATADAAAAAEVHPQSTQADDGSISARSTKSANICELPSIHKLQQKADPLLPVAPSPLRAPGVRAFRTDAAALLQPVPSSTRRPLATGFYWRAALWTVAVAFCAAVYAHTLRRLPPAPYVLILIAVRCACCDAIVSFMTHTVLVLVPIAHVTKQAMAIITLLSRFTVRALAYQAKPFFFYFAALASAIANVAHDIIVIAAATIIIIIVIITAASQLVGTALIFAAFVTPSGLQPSQSLHLASHFPLCNASHFPLCNASVMPVCSRDGAHLLPPESGGSDVVDGYGQEL
jgi:hypothetical protein